MNPEHPLNTWQLLTRRGNTCFHSGAYQKASQFYQQALVKALEDYPVETAFEQSVIAVITSYHNLAELHERCHRLEAARANLSEAFHFIQQEIFNAHPKLKRISLLKVANITVVALKHFEKKHPQHSPEKDTNHEQKSHRVVGGIATTD